MSLRRRCRAVTPHAPRIAAWLLVAVASCHHADAVDGAARRERVVAPAVAMSPPALVPAPLTWDMSEEQAFERLAAAGFTPRADAQHGYFSTPEEFHATPGTIAVAHTVEPVVLYVPRAGWTGVAHYERVGGPLQRVELTARLTPADAEAELAALERRYGTPNDRHRYPADGEGAAGALRLVWVRGGVWLVAIAAADGAVSVAYRRDDRSAAEVGR